MGIRLILALVVGLTCFSCQSEYGERMSKAIALKKKYENVLLHCNNAKNPMMKLQLNAIKKEIQFHATVSGNEQLFLEEVWN